MIKVDERDTGRRSWLQVALNGTRTRADHPSIPITPEQHAREASAAVAAGADAIHVHVRDAGGTESLAPEDVAATLEAIRTACPGTPVGISTGAWIIPDLSRRLATIRAWEILPDFASVNLHEAGALCAVRVLLEKGIDVEAGVWNRPAAQTLVDSGLADQCLRILIEPAECSCRARVNFQQIEAALSEVDRPRLLHGLGPWAWEFIALAAKRGYQTRIGFEDTLTLPDGSRAASNADLVNAAWRIMLGSVTPSNEGATHMANPFVHVELNTTDPAKAKAFYSKLFTWKMEDMPMGPDMTYTMIQPGEGTGGGLMKQPIPGAPSAWLAYVVVDDVKSATEKAKSLGARVMKEVTEVPDMGWFSIITDPTGALLGLWQTK